MLNPRNRLLIVLSILATSLLLAGSISAADFDAEASVEPTAQYLDDTTGVVFTFTITNTGTSASIGAVEIERPSASWKITACPLAPAGWRSQDSSTKCRYRSAEATADDLVPGRSTSDFQVRAKTTGGTANQTGTWKITVSRSNQFDNISLLPAEPATPEGLTVTLYSWEILDAVVMSGPATPGSACPAPNKEAITGSTHTIVICGRNRTQTALTPTSGQSSLSGTFVQTPGTFSSGQIAANSASSVVLANWTGTRITNDVGLHMTVIATIGSSSQQTSPRTVLADYAATNQSPTANPDNATTDEDGFRTIDVLANDTDPESDALTVSNVDVTATQGVVTNHGTDVVYEPGSAFQSLAQGQSGSDSFTYTANDGHGDSNAAMVSVTITGMNDAPTELALSNATVDENQAPGATLGSFTTTDVDLGDAHTYTLISGLGDADNASFQIAGATLRTTAAFDFETKASYSIRVETRDSAGAAYSRPFTISVNDVNEAPTDITLSNATIAEDRAAGEPVGTLAAVDPDTGRSHTFTLIAGAGDNALFQIPFGGDTLQTAEVFDYEAKNSYTVHVRATDGDGLSVDKEFTITVTDVNEAPAVVPATFSIPENSANGTVVGTVTYGDPESGQSHTFDIPAGNVGGAFTIDPTTGAVTVLTGGMLDFETNPSFSLTVRVTDNGTPPESGSATVTVNLTNVNEAPIVAQATFWLAENSASGTAVGAVTSSDPDPGQAYTFSITGGNTGGAFAIDATSGEIAVLSSAAMDFETVPGFSLTVRVTDDGAPPLSGSATVRIHLTDVNESPTDLTLSDSGVDENLPSGAAVGQLAAVDQDAGQTHAFTLVAGDGDADNGSFTIAGSSLRTAEVFDFETKSTYTVRVQGADSGSPSLSFEKQLAVIVHDGNEEPVVSVAAFATPENSADATAIGTVTYADPDGGQLHTFTITAGNSGGAFAINAATGEITVASSAALDFETTPTFSLIVEVADNGSPALSGSATVTIDLTDLAEAPSDIVLSHGSVPETALVGTAVGTFTTIDPEAPHTYALVAGDGDTDNASFQVAGDALQTATPLDYELKNSYSIRVQATDNTGQVFAKVFTILVTDVTERGSAPTDIGLSNSTVNENLPAGAPVGSFSTIGPDTYTYSLVAGAGDTDNASFQISGSQLQTGAAFDFEAKNSYALRVRTTDSGTPAASLEKQFIVSVNDVNEVPTGIALSNASVNENQPSGAIVGTLSGTDPDAGQTLTFSLSDPSGDNASFQLIGATLMTAAILDHEAKDSYTIQVRATDDGAPAQFTDKQLTISVNDLNDPPVAAPDTFSPDVALGNTLLSVGVTTSGQPAVNITGNLLANDTDQEGAALTAVAEKVPSIGGGTATINANGSFTFLPGVGDKYQADTFIYHVTDGVATTAGTVTVGIASSLVWYVNNATPNGDGRSNAPLATLAAAEAASGPGDILFVYEGNTVKKPLGGGIALKDRQKLHGEGVGLVVPGFGTLVPAGNRPRINNTAGDAVSVPAVAGHRNAVEVRGFDLQGTGNAVDVTAGGANVVGVILSDNTIRGAGAEGIDLNAGSTGSFIATVQNNTVTATGNGIDARTSAATALVLAINTNTGITSGATGILVDGSGGGATTITSFAGNSVSGATAGAGISINSATFDATPGGSFQTVAAGVTAIGAAGDGVGGAGLLLTHAAGDLSFTDLDVTADGGAGLRATGLAPYTGSAGLRLAVSGAGATVTAVGGPALALDTVSAALPFQTISSTNSPTTGVALNSVTGSVSANAGSISNITSSAGTAFQATNSSAKISYAGTINTSAGKGVVLTGNAGGSIDFSGALTLGTGTNAAFEATGGGTVTATDSASTLATTTGDALNVTNTTIGAAGLKFRSISAGTTSSGPVNGIVLDNTGSAGGLTVTGAGSAGSGGTIQRAATGVNLNNTSNVSLSFLQLNDFADYAIRGTGVTNFALANTTVSGSSGDSTAALEGGVRFDGLLGTAGVTNSSFSGSLLQNFRVTNSSGTLDRATFSNDTFGLNNTASGDDGLQLEASGSAVMKVTVRNSFFTGARGDHFQFTTGPGCSGCSGDLVFTDNAISDNNPAIVAAGGGVTIGGAGGGFTYLVARNTLRDASGTSLVVSCGGAGSTCRGIVAENTIGVQETANSGTTGGSGIAMISSGGGTFITAVMINHVYQYNNHAILLQAGDRQGNTLNFQASVMDNTVSNPGNINSSFNGIHLNNGTVATDNFTSCVDFARNTLTGAGRGAVSPDNADLRLRQRQGTAVLLPNYYGAKFDYAAVESYLRGQNTFTTFSASDTVQTGGGYVGGATCTWP